MITTPQSAMKKQFKTKEQLVDAVQKLATKDLWLDRVNEAKGLAKVSNAKLLRLHEILTRVKTEFGSRDKLIGAILGLEKRDKDAGYKTRLQAYPLPRLLDLHQAASRRSKHAAAKAKTAAPKPAKKAAAKKTASKKA
jgi:hypothetical protein